MIKEKTCTKCKETKSLELFSNNKKAKDGKAYSCKACRKAWCEANKEASQVYRDANKDRKKAWDRAHVEETKAYNNIRNESYRLPYHIVYALPDFRNDERAYCGVTNQPETRMYVHENSGNNTEGWFILGVFMDRDEAETAEALYHVQGYCGAKGWEAEYNKQTKQ